MLSIRRTSGVYATGETGLEFMPKGYRRDGTRPGVLLLHGYGENDSQAFAANPLTDNQAKIAQTLANAGFPCFAPLAGGNAIANDIALARVTDAKAYLQGVLGAKSGKIALLGLSMGGGTAMAWARANPTLVSCLVLLEPMSDLNDIVTNNRAGLASAANTAYGARSDTCGTTTGSATITDASIAAGDVGKAVYGPGIPANCQVGPVIAGVSFTLVAQTGGASVNATATSASVALQIGGYHDGTHGPTHSPVRFASQLAGIPAHVWYATGDNTVVPSTVQAVIAATGWTDVHTVPGDHGSGMYNQVDVAGVLSFLRANA